MNRMCSSKPIFAIIVGKLKAILSIGSTSNIKHCASVHCGIII